MLVFDESSMKTVIFELRLLKELKSQPDVGTDFIFINIVLSIVLGRYLGGIIYYMYKKLIFCFCNIQIIIKV